MVSGRIHSGSSEFWWVCNVYRWLDPHHTIAGHPKSIPEDHRFDSFLKQMFVC